MTKSILTCLVLSIISCASFGQSSADLVKSLNRFITVYSTDNAEGLSLQGNIGTLEQKINASSYQRIKLENIGLIKVEPNADGFAVNYSCFLNSHCINLIKNDMIGTSMPSNIFFFNSLKAANSFAKTLGELALKYPSSEGQIEVTLLKDIDGNTPLETNENTINITKAEKNAEANLIINTEDESDKPATRSKSKKTIKEINEEEDIEDEKPQLDKKKNRNDDDNVTQKKPRKKKEVYDDEEIETPIQPDIRRSNPLLNQDETETPQGICKQLLQILNAGKTSRFKEIEGRETNSEKKINESKIKIKGAKRNYISWYKKQRAFIAEFKTSSDNELILIEFERLQTELEDCLEAGWEDSDHSNDEQYANETKEIKDVEYKNTLDSTMPALRILMNTDENGKQTIFVRIQ